MEVIRHLCSAHQHLQNALLIETIRKQLLWGLLNFPDFLMMMMMMLMNDDDDDVRQLGRP